MFSPNKVLNIVGVATFSCMMMVSFNASAKRKTRSCEVTYSAVVGSQKRLLTKYKHKASAPRAKRARKLARDQAESCVKNVTGSTGRGSSCGSHLVTKLKDALRSGFTTSQIVRLRADSRGHNDCVASYERTVPSDVLGSPKKNPLIPPFKNKKSKRLPLDVLNDEKSKYVRACIDANRGAGGVDIRCNDHYSAWYLCGRKLIETADSACRGQKGTRKEECEAKRWGWYESEKEKRCAARLPSSIKLPRPGEEPDDGDSDDSDSKDSECKKRAARLKEKRLRKCSRKGRKQRRSCTKRAESDYKKRVAKCR